MKQLLIFLFSVTVCSLSAQNSHVKNDSFEITGVKLIENCNTEGSCLELSAKGIFEHFYYPEVKIKLNGKVISPQLGPSYGLRWEDKSKLMIVDLDKLPESFDLEIIVISAYTAGKPKKVFTYKKKKSEQKGPRGISSIELKEIGGERILEFAFDGMKDEDFWSYPTYKVEIDGKVVGKKGLSSYGLFKGMKGMVPTKLKKLPKHFKAKIYLGSHGSEDKSILEYEQ